MEFIRDDAPGHVSTLPQRPGPVVRALWVDSKGLRSERGRGMGHLTRGGARGEQVDPGEEDKKNKWKMENGLMNFKILVFLIQLYLIPPPVHVPGQSPQARKDDKRKSNNPLKRRRSKQVAAEGSSRQPCTDSCRGHRPSVHSLEVRPAAAGPSRAFQRELRIAPNLIERPIDGFK